MWLDSKLEKKQYYACQLCTLSLTVSFILCLLFWKFKDYCKVCKHKCAGLQYMKQTHFHYKMMDCLFFTLLSFPNMCLPFLSKLACLTDCICRAPFHSAQTQPNINLTNLYYPEQSNCEEKKVLLQVRKFVIETIYSSKYLCIAYVNGTSKQKRRKIHIMIHGRAQAVTSKKMQYSQLTLNTYVTM